MGNILLQVLKVELDRVPAPHAPLGSVGGQCLANARWRTPALVDCIVSAANDFDGDVVGLSSSVAAARTDSPPIGIQAAASQFIHSRPYPNTMLAQVCRRLAMWWPGARSIPQYEETVCSSLKLLFSQHMFIVPSILRTWFNGWTTSHRGAHRQHLVHLWLRR